MKTIRFTVFFALCIALFAACSKDDEVLLDDFGKPQDNKTYTIMMYGCGGGNLDKAMIQNIEEAYLVGSSDRVNFIGQVNFSAAYQTDPERKGTLRFKVGPTPGEDFKPEKYSENVINLAKPENLTDFINWSKKECPADEYILLLWNHGGGWVPQQDAPETRGIVCDDNFGGECLTLDNMVKGIYDSDVVFKMIYFDACLMGQMEVLTGIMYCADYAMCASHITPGLGGDYNSLMYHLSTPTNFEDSMKEYCRETVSHWNYTNWPLDLKVIDLDKFDDFIDEVEVFSDLVYDVTKHTDDILLGIEAGKIDKEKDVDEMVILEMFSNAVNKCYHFEGMLGKSYPFYDLLQFAELFTTADYNPYSAKFVDISSRLNRSWNAAVVCNQTTNITVGHDFSVGVTIVDDMDWEIKDYDTSYNGLEFDKRTNWGAWLSINPIEPEGNPDPNIFIKENQQGEQ